MKPLLSLLLVAILSLSLNPSRAAGANSGEPRIEVLFSRAMDFADLVKIRTELAQKGIALDYRKLEFDAEGKLLEIHFAVNCGDGFSGSAQRRLTYDSRFGFFRDYAKEARTPFGTGNLVRTKDLPVSYRNL
jgi:hypothetical protein